MISLDVFADPVCPWCLIGAHELARAVDSRPGHPFELTWHPFRLNPDMPKSGMARADYLRAKLGENAEAAEAAVARRAHDLGLALNPAPREPDTTDAHRLMHWAGLEGAQTRVMWGLLRAHWQEARDIGSPAELAAIATEAGLDGAMIAHLLTSDADLDEVALRDAHARQRGVDAVPTFIVAGRHVLSGAQPASLWESVIDELAARG